MACGLSCDSGRLPDPSSYITHRALQRGPQQSSSAKTLQGGFSGDRQFPSEPCIYRNFSQILQSTRTLAMPFSEKIMIKPTLLPLTGSLTNRNLQRGKQILQDIKERCWALLDLDSCPHRSPSPPCCTGLGETEPMARKRLTSTGPEQSS